MYEETAPMEFRLDRRVIVTETPVDYLKFSAFVTQIYRKGQKLGLRHYPLYVKNLHRVITE